LENKRIFGKEEKNKRRIKKMKVFITGLPGCGKSTVLMKVIQLLREKGLKVGGIITPEIRVEGKRIAFAVRDIYSGKEGILASVEQKTGPRLGKYRVNLESFEEVALLALNFALKECDIVAIDEIGKMEFFSEKFKEKVYEIIRSNKPLIAVVHRNYVKEFRNFGKMILVTKENRDELPEMILSWIKVFKNL
jgi:nucleoside-triphosphatase